MKKICVVTGSRADYGLLRPVMKKIRQRKDLRLQIIATGMHMDERCNLTYRDIERDGFYIEEKIEMNLATDTTTGICRSMGLEMIGISDAYRRLQPDMIILLGDRYEIFIAASAAMIENIPIAHIHGGEITQGAVDDCMRHAITKMSYLHFTSTEEYRNRVIQLGEQPDRVFCVGALGIENIKEMSLLTRQELEEQLGMALHSPLALITFHPVTLEGKQQPAQIQCLLDALDSFPELFLLFTRSNSDAGGSAVHRMIEEYVEKKEHAAAFTSLGSLKYLSLMKQAAVVIGNSSSGIIEAPYFCVPTVDIGSRQEGRIKPKSVIHCGTAENSIQNAIHRALHGEYEKEQSPYEKEDTSEQIVSIISRALDSGIQLKKVFYDIGKERGCISKNPY